MFCNVKGVAYTGKSIENFRPDPEFLLSNNNFELTVLILPLETLLLWSTFTAAGSYFQQKSSKNLLSTKHHMDIASIW